MTVVPRPTGGRGASISPSVTAALGTRLPRASLARMGRHTDDPVAERPLASGRSVAFGLVLLVAGVGVAVVHLVLAPTAFLQQRRTGRGAAASSGRG